MQRGWDFVFAYIGRQPLYNREYVLYGYDLLHRDNVTKVLRDIADEDEELRNVFSDSISMFNFDELTEGLLFELADTYSTRHISGSYPNKAPKITKTGDNRLIEGF